MPIRRMDDETGNGDSNDAIGVLQCDAVALVAGLVACSQPTISSGPGRRNGATAATTAASLLPNSQVASAKGWSDGAKPIAAKRLAVSAFATGLDHPRWLYTLPNGDVLVAETNAPTGRKTIRAFERSS